MCARGGGLPFFVKIGGTSLLDAGEYQVVDTYMRRQAAAIVHCISNVPGSKWFEAGISCGSFCFISFKSYDREFSFCSAGMDSCYFYFMAEQLDTHGS